MGFKTLTNKHAINNFPIFIRTFHSYLSDDVSFVVVVKKSTTESTKSLFDAEPILPLSFVIDEYIPDVELINKIEINITFFILIL